MEPHRVSLADQLLCANHVVWWGRAVLPQCVRDGMLTHAEAATRLAHLEAVRETIATLWGAVPPGLDLPTLRPVLMQAEATLSQVLEGWGLDDETGCEATLAAVRRCLATYFPASHPKEPTP